MNDATHAHADHGHGHDEAPHFTRKGYLIGFLLSVVLTAIPFWMVMTGALENPQTTGLIVVAFAAVQIVVHTIFFLHVNTRAEGGWTLMAYVFTAVIVLIVLAGSLWIMYHLNTNMMPMAAAEMGAQP